MPPREHPGSTTNRVEKRTPDVSCRLHFETSFKSVTVLLGEYAVADHPPKLPTLSRAAQVFTIFRAARNRSSMPAPRQAAARSDMPVSGSS